MPTYEYQCLKCGVVFDEFQSINAEPLKDCPKCKKKGSLKRLIGTGGGILFKGSGFYQTDYRSESYRKAADKEKGKKETKKDTGSGSGKDK
jgi:putative FmdB family regulatory protein